MQNHLQEEQLENQGINNNEDQRKRSNVSKKFLKHHTALESDFESNQVKGKKKVGRWTEEEDRKLQTLIQEYGEKSWRIISDMMQGRSAIQCLHRWTKILKPGLRKGPWQEEEDERLLVWVKNNGPCKWSICAENILGRSGKQCRERWFNNLNPNVKKGGWTQQEDQEIFKGYLQYSSSWSKIARSLSGRTENSVKNRFYSTVRKLLADQEKEGGPRKNPSGAALKIFIREQLIKNGGMQEGDPKIQSASEFAVEEEEEEEEDEEIFQEDQLKKEENNSIENQSQHEDEDDKSKKKNIQGYPEQNLLYRLLKQQGGPIKRTSCMKDYSTIYKKYKKRYIQKKRDKKLSEKLDILRHLIMKREDDKEEVNNFDRNDKKGMEFLQKNSLKSDLEKQIMRVGSELAQLQSQQHKPLSKLSSNQLIKSPPPEQQSLTSGQMAEFQNKLLEFFNQSLTEVMKKFQQDIGAKTNKGNVTVPQWQMILAPSDARIVYPPANMPRNLGDQFQSHPIQIPNILLSRPFVEKEQQESKVKSNKKSRRGQKKVKLDDSQAAVSPYDSIVQSFFSKFSHLSQIGISQLGLSIGEGRDVSQKNDHLQQDNKIDQKMMFLISQLHTLESMLTNTKKELGRLEASLHEKISINNNSFDSASGSSGEKLKREEP